MERLPPEYQRDVSKRSNPFHTKCWFPNHPVILGGYLNCTLPNVNKCIQAAGSLYLPCIPALVWTFQLNAGNGHGEAANCKRYDSGLAAAAYPGIRVQRLSAFRENQIGIKHAH